MTQKKSPTNSQLAEQQNKTEHNNYIRLYRLYKYLMRTLMAVNLAAFLASAYLITLKDLSNMAIAVLILTTINICLIAIGYEQEII